jgi:two-component system sensor histidine kinase QseC
VITLVTFAAAIQGYRGSMAKATSVFDNELRSLTYVLVNITDLSTQSLAPQPLIPSLKLLSVISKMNSLRAIF